MAKKRGANEGSIYRRSDGRWCATVDLGWESGKRKRKYLYGETRAEVANQLTRVLNEKVQGLPVAVERQTVAQFLTGWLDSAQPSIRPRTFERFEGIVRLHIIPTLGRFRLDRLRAQHVQALLNRKGREGLSAQSVKHIRTVLSIALNRAVKWNMIGRNVAALTDAPKIEREPVATLSLEEARKLLDAASGDRLEGLLSVALAVGLRRGEALGLSWSDVDLDAGVIRVSHSLQRVGGRLQLVAPKTSQSRRSIAIPEVVVKALRRHRARQSEDRLAAGSGWQDSGLIFTSRVGTPIEPRNMIRAFKGLLKKAGLPAARFHDLRHTAASILLAQGVHPRAVMEILGHSRISLTMDTYSHVMPSVLREAADKMGLALGG